MGVVESVKEDLSPGGPLNHKGLLVGEMVVVGGTIAVSALTAGSAPKPSQFVGVWALYEALAIGTDVGPNSARVAAALGGLVAVAVVLAHASGYTAFANWISGGGPTNPAKAVPVGTAPPDLPAGFYNVPGPRKPHGRPPVPTNHGG